MQLRQKMHLTDDGVHTFRRGSRTINVRIRIWRLRGENAVCLVEPAPGKREQNIRPWAPRIGTHVHHVAFKGMTRAFCYVERSGDYDSERWDLVEFATVRHHYCDPTRKTISRATVENFVGQSV